MNLHGLQVTISASNAANIYQSVLQQQAHQAQLQQSLNMSAQADIKQTQPQQVEERAPFKTIGDNESRQREWKKNRSGGRMDTEAANKEENNNTPAFLGPAGSVIDIKA
ncbi:MAG TPA: hypothetical protein ENN43_03550 [bacterium]|nr:hypothetical protein [bacterium]